MVEALRKLASRRVEGLEDLPDDKLVAMCQKELPADLTAYRELLRRYEGLIYNTCFKLLGSRADAEEVAQDAMIQVFHKIHQFEGRAAFKTWLYKIVHNYCRNRISKIIRKREGQEAYEQHAADTMPDSDNPAENFEMSAHVEEALGKLKERDREIVVLKFMSGLTLQEIADVLDLGLSAAKMRLYRALDEFKEAYLRLEGDAPVPLPTEE
ncbi:MAG: sigma-70 family RNA polymerase sigma factor [Akkermansiaceae bacterium]|nr:sigma-70 family RNA polymerase sigma factor [Akkermansiaceae bacterium]